MINNSGSCKNLQGVFRLHPLSVLNRELSDWFENVLESPGDKQCKKNEFCPKFNLEDSKDKIIVTADMPGVKDEDLDIQLSDGALVVSGSRSKDFEEKEDNYYYVERSYGSFKRVIPFKVEVDAEGISAALKNGVLTIEVPKKLIEEPKTKKIVIKSE